MLSLEQSTDLISLAKSREPGDRERLLMGVVSLCEQGVSNEAQDEQSRALLDQVFMALVLQAEQEVRQRLSERIADAVWAPKALINILALDDIEIARPVIAASPLLGDADLIRLVVESTLEHQIEVARRPNIHESVADAIIEESEPAALAALANNDTARIGAEGMGKLVESARRLPALRAPLARHPRLTETLGVRLYAWVGEALRTSVATRFKLDEAALAAAIDQAVEEVWAETTGGVRPLDRSLERELVELTLVEKLDAAGQLKPGYLLRSLREQKLSLFSTALAKLGGLDTEDVRRAIASDRPELLALACIAAGVDRGVFPTVLGLVQNLNNGRPRGGQDGQQRALAVFHACAPALAAGNFRRVLSAI